MLYCTVGGLIGYSQSRVKKRKTHRGRREANICIFSAAPRPGWSARLHSGTAARLPRFQSVISPNTVELHLHRGSNCRQQLEFSRWIVYETPLSGLQHNYNHHHRQYGILRRPSSAYFRSRSLEQQLHWPTTAVSPRPCCCNMSTSFPARSQSSHCFRKEWQRCFSLPPTR